MKKYTFEKLMEQRPDQVVVSPKNLAAILSEAMKSTIDVQMARDSSNSSICLSWSDPDGHNYHATIIRIDPKFNDSSDSKTQVSLERSLPEGTSIKRWIDDVFEGFQRLVYLRKYIEDIPCPYFYDPHDDIIERFKITLDDAGDLFLRTYEDKLLAVRSGESEETIRKLREESTPIWRGDD